MGGGGRGDSPGVDPVEGAAGDRVGAGAFSEDCGADGVDVVGYEVEGLGLAVAG